MLEIDQNTDKPSIEETRERDILDTASDLMFKVMPSWLTMCAYISKGSRMGQIDPQFVEDNKLFIILSTFFVATIGWIAIDYAKANIDSEKLLNSIFKPIEDSIFGPFEPSPDDLIQEGEENSNEM